MLRNFLDGLAYHLLVVLEVYRRSDRGLGEDFLGREEKRGDGTCAVRCTLSNISAPSWSFVVESAGLGL